MVKTAELWQWSSYRAMAGLEQSEPFMHPDWLAAWLIFRYKISSPERLYFFCSCRVRNGQPLEGGKRGAFRGRLSICGKIPGITGDCCCRNGSGATGKYAARPPLEDIFSSQERNAGSHDAVIKWGYALKEVGAYVGLHYPGASRIAFLMAESKKAKNKT